MLKPPLIIVNFKAFKSSTGKNAIALAKLCEKIAKSKKANIAVAVQPADIYRVSNAVSIPVLAQHADANEYGQFTGSVLAEDVKENGAKGSLLNHSEKRISYVQIAKTIKKLKRLGMKSVVCAATPEEAKRIAKLKPDFIAIEPPELIGGKISVSSARPGIITATTKAIKDIPVLCGAGIKTKDDVKKAVQLGVKGILVASGVANARNPGKVLNGLVEGLEEGISDGRN